jgi:sulfur-oxidizing protein SoxB
MLSRRDLLEGLIAATMVPGTTTRAGVSTITQESLLAFKPIGQVTLLSIADLHAQLVPLYAREPSTNIGVGAASGVPPHVTGDAFLQHFTIPPGSVDAYALSSHDFTALAQRYGRMGGLDRIATVVAAIRAERPNQTLLLDGGDSWQGSYTALATRGGDMARAMASLGVDAMTGHWEFTYGADRVVALSKAHGVPLLCGNVTDTTWGEEVFAASATFERGGLKIVVIGQAFPYTPIANPRWLIPDWSFGIKEDVLRRRVDKARAEGADLVVLLSHDGFDVDRKLASRVDGIDVILTAHTHDALPVPIRVGDTLLVAVGSHGKFVGRLDLDVRQKRVVSYAFRLIPIIADAIVPDPTMANLIADVRRPHETAMNIVLGHTESLLYRRGNFNGSFDDLICEALLSERESEIAFSPGFRWGETLLPGQPIRVEHVYGQTGIPYPAVYRRDMTGAAIKDLLEQVADNLFNPDPYYQQGGDMVRAGGLAYTIDVGQTIGHRIGDLVLTRSDEPIMANKSYVVSGWGSVAEDVSGPPIHDLVCRHIQRVKVVDIEGAPRVRIRNADPRGISD